MKAIFTTWTRGNDRSFLLAALTLATLAQAIPLRAAEATSHSPATRPLKLSDCFQLALEHNLDLKIERQNNRIDQATLYGSYGAYDPTLKVSATQSRLDAPEIFDIKKSSLADARQKIDTGLLSGGIGGKLPTGGTYDLGGNLTKWRAFGDLRNFGLGDIWRTNEYGVSSAFSLSQPLLRNLWIDQDRLHVQVSKKQLKVSEMALLSKMMSVTRDVQKAYLELGYAQRLVELYLTHHDHANRLLQEVRSRIQTGTLPPLEEKLFDFAVQTTGADLAQAQRELGDAQSALRNLVTEDLKDWMSVVPLATDPLGEIEEQFNQVESWRDAMTKRPEIRQMQLDLEKQDIVLRYSRNQLYPSLDLVASYGLSGVNPSLGTAGGDVANGDHSSYSYGVVMSVPLSNRSARGRYRANREAKEQSILRMKKLEMEVLTSVETAGRLMTASYQRLAPAQKAIELAEQVVQSEEAKIRLSQTTSFNAVEARRRLVNSQITHLRALTEYNKARAEHAFTQGEILDQNSINVDFK